MLDAGTRQTNICKLRYSRIIAPDIEIQIKCSNKAGMNCTSMAHTITSAHFYTRLIYHVETNICHKSKIQKQILHTDLIPNLCDRVKSRNATPHRAISCIEHVAREFICKGQMMQDLLDATFPFDI